MTDNTYMELEQKINLCKYELEENERALSQISSDTNHGLRRPDNHPNRPFSPRIDQQENGILYKPKVETEDTFEEHNRSQGKYKNYLSCDQNFIKLNMEDQLKLAKLKQASEQRVAEELHGSLTQIADQQKNIEQLKLDNEYSMRCASEMTERYKKLVSWMQVIVTSTKTPSSTQEEYDFSNEAVRRLKTEIATSITQFRENAVQIEELKKNLSSKELQISHLKGIISQLGAGFRRSGDDFEKAERESCLERVKLQRSQYEDNSIREKTDSPNSNTDFRHSLAEMLNHSAWICGESEKEIFEVIRRVLATLTSKTETCSRLQDQYSELTDQLADSKRTIEHLENVCLSLQAKRYRGPTKSVEFLNRITDLEDSHERLHQFLKQLEDRLPVDQSIFAQMSVSDQQSYILDCISKACAPSMAKSGSELAPRLHKRVQRLQDDLVSCELQQKTWKQKVTKLEEQLVLARKAEAEAVERQTLAERRVCRLKNNEREVNRLKNEATQLKTQLRDCRDAKDRLEERALRVLELEESVCKLEEIKLRQEHQIDELVRALEKEKAVMAEKFLKQEEEERVRFNIESRDKDQLLEELRTESLELRNFRDIVGRLLGMRLEDLVEPSKEILHGVERLLKESRRNSLHRGITCAARSISPRRLRPGSSAQLGSTQAFSDPEPAPIAVRGPMQHTEVGHARSGLRPFVPPPQRPPSTTSTFVSSSSTSRLGDGEHLPPRDSRRY